ncbi:MAG: hypothetical protein ACO3S5_13370 [Ilumatobacteraceae bacterium]
MKMRCLETRETPDGFRRRRYEVDGMRERITTYEVPAQVLRAIGMSLVRQRIEVFRRGLMAREKAAMLKDEVRKREDWKATAVAHELGITEARVRQIRQELKKGITR